MHRCYHVRVSALWIILKFSFFCTVLKLVIINRVDCVIEPVGPFGSTGSSASKLIWKQIPPYPPLERSALRFHKKKRLCVETDNFPFCLSEEIRCHFPLWYIVLELMLILQHGFYITAFLILLFCVTLNRTFSVSF